jgi:hypothetical protein
MLTRVGTILNLLHKFSVQNRAFVGDYFAIGGESLDQDK